MQISFGTERGRSLGAWYILYIACFTVPITFYRAAHPNGWTPGDWLVNYEGGFVRRGLPGESILLVSHALHLSPVLLGSVLPLIFYLLLYLSLWQLFRRSSGHLCTVAALISPATLAFPILDPVGAFRKELLLLLGLAVLLLLLTRASPRDGLLTAYLTVLGVLSILSHEGLLPYLLYLVCALAIALHDTRRVLRITALPLVCVAITLFAVLAHRGSLAAEQTICRSLGAAPPIVCSGSIAYLVKGTSVARADVMRNIHAYHYLFYYPLLATLAVLPLAGMWARLRRDPRTHSDLRVIAWTAVIAVAATLPLFLYAMDWGRWIYIHVTSLFLLLLFLDIREQHAAAAPGRVEEVGPRRYPAWAFAALVLYATCWNLPHYGNYPKKGYLNLPLHLLKQRLEQHAGHPAPAHGSRIDAAPHGRAMAALQAEHGWVMRPRKATLEAAGLLGDLQGARPRYTG